MSNVAVINISTPSPYHFTSAVCKWCSYPHNFT